MDKEKYASDLREIKEIMSRTTPFISLSGLSGVSTGIIAMAGALIAFKTVFNEREYLRYDATALPGDHHNLLLVIAFGTLMLSIASAIFFTRQKTKRQKQRIWDIHSKQLLINLSIPLITGGFLCLMFLDKGFIGILPSMTLIFYGLALINGSKYTLPEIRNLGIIQIILGLLAFQFINYGLLFWAFGFGVVQIIYGLIIQRKY